MALTPEAAEGAEVEAVVEAEEFRPQQFCEALLLLQASIHLQAEVALE